MLSREKAKFRSAFERTMSQMHRDRVLKKRASQALGMRISFRMNLMTFFMRREENSPIELIEAFKNNWLMVSQILVRTINEKIRKSPAFI
jgi:hypothetical protein